MAGLAKDDLCRVLVVGVGSIGERHARCFQITGRARVSICELNTNLRGEVARRYGIERVFADVDTALAEPHDAAVIAVPANHHIDVASRALQLGLHVLIEKPLSVSLEGVDEIVRIASERRRVVAIGYVHRANPSLAEMRNAIFSGQFGRPLQLVAVTGQHFPTYRPAYRSTYFANRATGGGAIQDALTHILNAGEWLVGPIDRLVADAEHKALEDVTVEDAVHVLARHGNVLASYSLNQFQAPNEFMITVVCERGTARFESHKQRWRYMLRPDEEWHDELAAKLQRDALFVSQAESFLDAIDGRGNVLCTLEEGVQTLRVNLAALKSVESRSWQEVLEV
jgi:predicted dehydrogenase